MICPRCKTSGDALEYLGDHHVMSFATYGVNGVVYEFWSCGHCGGVTYEWWSRCFKICATPRDLRFAI